MLDLHRLRLLRELKHRGTLAAVAKALSYNPSTISQQLAVLEREVGVPLLEPVGRRVRLTAEAELLVGHAEAVLEQLERAEADIALMRGTPAGTIRIATFQTVAHSLVLPMLTSLRTHQPAMRPDVTQLEAQRALPALLAGDYDVVVAEEYPGATTPVLPGLEYEQLCLDPLLLAVPDGWGLGDAPTADELADRPWVMETPVNPARAWAVQSCRAMGFEPRIRFESPDVLLHVRLVEAGHAAAFLPGLVRRCGHPDVRLRPLPGEVQQRTIFTGIRTGTSAHPAIRHVRRELRRLAQAD
jgi:DNA-binding transcriptional LysR family regulator